MTAKANPEYDNFKSLLRKVVSVPHSEIKAALDAEKRTRSRRRKRKSVVPQEKSTPRGPA